MKRRWFSVLCFLLLLIPLARLAHGSEPQDLATGIKAYWDADYKKAVSTLKAVNPEDLSPQERILRHKFLALSLFARNDKSAAEEAFAELLKVDPSQSLSEPDFSADIVKCFRRARTALSNRMSDVGIEQYRAKNKKDAESAFRQALTIDPGNPIAKDFLPLVQAPKGDKTPTCTPSLTWGSINTRDGLCKGVDVSSTFKLPVTANKITLIYAVHHTGAGPCWKLVLYGNQGQVVHSFDDPKGEFASEKEPEEAARWRVVELPEVTTIAKVVMYSSPSPVFKRILSKDLGKNLLDTFILSLEKSCSQGASDEHIK